MSYTFTDNRKLSEKKFDTLDELIAHLEIYVVGYTTNPHIVLFQDSQRVGQIERDPESEWYAKTVLLTYYTRRDEPLFHCEECGSTKVYNWKCSKCGETDMIAIDIFDTNTKKLCVE